MSKNIVFEGWLTKSPPSKRIWRTKWRRRWFALRQSGELPGQYFLDYYADRNCRRLKGTINLDFCEQVDAGLHMERTNQGAPDPKLRGSVFTIQTQSRTYHLEADCESEMEKWVAAICSVCGLRATDETPSYSGIYQNHSVAVDNHPNTSSRNNSNVTTPTVNGQVTTMPVVNNVNYGTIAANGQQHSLVSNDEDNAIAIANDEYECGESTGPYIPISECITGVRAPDTQRAFTFDPKNIVTSTKTFDKSDASNKFKTYSYHGTPQIRINNVAVESENDSNSEDECRSLNASQYNIGEVTVAKSFTRLNINSQRSNGTSYDGPPVPPRPPKTFSLNKDLAHRESFHGPKVQEPIELQENTSPFPWMRLPRPTHHNTAPSSPGRSVISHCVRTTDDEDDAAMGHSMQYCNLSTLPPAVDRALKPRHSSHSIGNMYNFSGLGICDETKPDVLQYLDLDLHTSTPPSSNPQDFKKLNIIHGKSHSSADADSAYKTVDFLKTEAFNITRQDAEASRSVQQ
ncbi:GRB2-associated-binding protein 1 [Nymphalis io]|uniref:GRB2-associated-binding protein 1 n=1 Tax=Inachis io TaxID=171585 RepID=UPI00216A4F8E|nr:GRB2-associated-binding protein 1 [Nymphalis io]